VGGGVDLDLGRGHSTECPVIVVPGCCVE
jgi:hypothetical protein